MGKTDTTNASGRDPKTGEIERCTILTGYHGWQDGVIFPHDPAPHDAGHVYGANEIRDLVSDAEREAKTEAEAEAGVLNWGPMQWEHKMDVGDFGIVTAPLDYRGKDGWELVTLFPTGEHGRYGGKYCAVWKRPAAFGEQDRDDV